VECLSVKLSQLKICCTEEIKEQINLIYTVEHGYRNEFLPFFYPNPLLPTLYDKICHESISSHEKEKIKAWKEKVQFVTNNKRYRDNEDRCFLLDSKDYCHSEDVWSERLGNILRTLYPNEIEVTAARKGYAANEVILAKLPKGATINMMLFHGCPDLIISSYPLMVAEGCIENKQQCEFHPYSKSSPIPDQCGQLLACMYQIMVVEYLKHLMNGKECAHVKSQGMFIICKSDVHLFSACISDGGLQIKAESFTSFGNEIGMFCEVMDRFIKSIK